MYTASKCFHTTGITLALNEDIRETTIEMIKRFKAAGTLVSFDVNFRGNLWTGDQARECILRILPYVDIFFCSEDTARLTFLKTGTAREMMKSFTEEFPISIVASTQRIVHSPKRHTFGSVIYDAARDEYYEEEPYRDIEVDRIGSGDAYISGRFTGCSVQTVTVPGPLPSAMPRLLSRTPFPETCRLPTWKKSRPSSMPTIRQDLRARWPGKGRPYLCKHFVTFVVRFILKFRILKKYFIGYGQ